MDLRYWFNNQLVDGCSAMNYLNLPKNTFQELLLCANRYGGFHLVVNRYLVWC